MPAAHLLAPELVAVPRARWRRGCSGKVRMTLTQAAATVERYRRQHGAPGDKYVCAHCGFYHVAAELLPERGWTASKPRLVTVP